MCTALEIVKVFSCDVIEQKVENSAYWWNAYFMKNVWQIFTIILL